MIFYYVYYFSDGEFHIASNTENILLECILTWQYIYYIIYCFELFSKNIVISYKIITKQWFKN